MTMMEQAPRQVAVKVSPEGDKLITSGAHYLHMSKKDLVEAAVAFYLDTRREEMQAGMRELLSTLAGSAIIRQASRRRMRVRWGIMRPLSYTAGRTTRFYEVAAESWNGRQGSSQSGSQGHAAAAEDSGDPGAQ